MEGPNAESCGFRWPLQRNPLGHLRGGLVREGQEKDTSWIYPLIQQALNSRHQRAGLSGAWSSLEKERVPAMVGCLFLLLVEWNFDRRFYCNYWHRGEQKRIKHLLCDDLEGCTQPVCNLRAGQALSNVQIKDSRPWQQQLSREEVHLDFSALPSAVIDYALHANWRSLRGSRW